jgi:hypothetical protein
VRHDSFDVKSLESTLEPLNLLGCQGFAGPLPLIPGEYLNRFAANPGSSFRGIADTPLD